MIDLDQVVDSQFIPTCEEERLINEVKPKAFKAIKTWIESVTQKYFSDSNDFRKSLADGILLCNLLNCLKPGSVKRITKISTPISGYDNIGKFLRCCEEDFGLSSLILFELSDLEDLGDKFPRNQYESEKRLERVLMCLFHLAKSVENHLTSVTIDSAPFALLLKSQDYREMKKRKSCSDDSVFNSPVPGLIQKQTPDYLTKTAEETMNKTKINQEMLKKSLESDDWQESLENWRERRRQALSQSVVENTYNNTDSTDSRNLVKLKEQARKMKELRDQIKSDSMQTSFDQSPYERSMSIPDIDEETRAMIEKVKLKKLAEEQKRRFSESSPNLISFASDSEHSTSGRAEKPSKTSCLPEKNDSQITKSPVSHKLSEPNVDTLDKVNNDKSESPPAHENLPTRIVHFKLNQKAKDSDQLWGMELTEKSGAILVGKVKIGSSADVCEIRKADEIISVNSKNVSRLSLDYVNSIFKEFLSAVSPGDCIIISVKRIINEDEDEEFLSEMLETTDDNSEGILGNESSNYDTEKYLKESNIHSFGTNIEDLNDLNNDITDLEFHHKSFTENSNNFLENANKHFTAAKVVEKLPNYSEDLSSVNNISAIHSEIPNFSVKNVIDNDNENEYQFSVQEKIAKFESQNVLNSSFLSSSLNISKTNNNDSVLTNVRYRHLSSCEGLSTNPDYLSSKNIATKESSISNTCLYWEKETPKPATNYHNRNVKSNSTVQAPFPSSNKDKNKENELEIAERMQDSSNINMAHSWRSTSSRNSSTSDDVSALNETIIMPQHGYPNHPTNSTFNNKENLINFNQGSHTTDKATKSFIPDHDHQNNVKKSPPINNVSTGIQANLQSRPPPIYTTITTAFESRNNRSYSNSVSRISDDDGYSISLIKYPETNIKNKNISTPVEYGKSVDNLQYSKQIKNDFSKDLTSVTPVIKETCITPSTGSNVSCMLNENEKSVEIEVSVTPQLFPMRHKTLLSRPTDDKLINRKSSAPVRAERSFDEDENTLKSDYIKITNLDDLKPTVKERSFSSVAAENVVIPSKKESNVSEAVKKENQPKLPIININEDSVKVDEKDYSNLFESNIDFEHSLSTVPAPTIFKGGPNSDNTISMGMSYSKSENVNSLKNNTDLSSKMSRKGYSKANEGLNSKRSSSTKELRILDDLDSEDLNKPNRSFRENLKNRRYSPSSQPQVRFSNVVQDITQTKTQTKTVSIEKPTKATSTSNREKKKQKSQNKKSSTLTTAKCNSCSEPAGSEDLMVIEELELHFHLRCFICSECKVKLGDGKTDTDVRIRRKKLHCAQCYNKKSSKSRTRDLVFKKPNQPINSNAQNKETEI